MTKPRSLLALLLTLPLLVLAVLVAGLSSGSAVAATPPLWSSVSDLPSYVPNMDGATVASGPTGTTLLLAGLTPFGGSYGNVGVWPVTAGSALPVQTDLFGEFESTKAEFLPNGDAIVSAYDPNNGETTLQYRSASGSFGGQVSVSGVSSYAANDDELLVTSAGSGASVTSYSIGSGGSLTQNGSAVQIFTDGTLFGETWTAIDPSGAAEVLVNAVDEQSGPDDGDSYMAEIGRSSAGAWSSPLQVPGSSIADENALEVAVAPTGAMIATWPADVEVNSVYYTVGFYASIREPGGSFGSPVQLLNQSNVQSGGIAQVLSPHVAAGPDGTLAATVTSDTCPNQQLSTDQTSSTEVWVAPPGGPLAAYQVPGTTLTSSFESRVTALGAGDGEAVVGLDDTDVVNAADTGGGAAWDEASCGEQTSYPTQTSLTDSAVVVGPGVDQSSPAFGVGGQVGTGAVTEVGVDGAALDPAGNATVIGDLNTSDASEYATFGTVGAAYSPKTTSTTTSTTTATPTTALPATPTTAPKQTPATIKLLTPNIVGQNGDQVITTSNTTDALENIAIAELAYASGLTKSNAKRSAVGSHKKARLIRVASGAIRLKPHKSGKLTLHLSRAARKVLAKKGGRLKVTLITTTKAAGHATTVVTRHLTLRAARTR